MPQMTERDYSTTKATDHRGKNLSKTNNNKVSFRSPRSWNANSTRVGQLGSFF
ncbi:hypothetical protein M153_1650002532 [Pseudoloma neurophilia]|uniref:Uncharacterized protein n=1 Tax=Pseudoloma neurophilia TaxID=146866 RepID=A0A0R0LZG1_9MICR|nr:hypothetical protein M153_1650002532 [Pseudoloma neurophilia]